MNQFPLVYADQCGSRGREVAMANTEDKGHPDLTATWCPPYYLLLMQVTSTKVGLAMLTKQVRKNKAWRAIAEAT